MKVKKLVSKKEEVELKKAIETATIENKSHTYKLKYFDLMISEGLDINYQEQKVKLETQKKESEGTIKFNEKLIKQYNEILKKGSYNVEEEENKSK